MSSPSSVPRDSLPYDRNYVQHSDGTPRAENHSETASQQTDVPSLVWSATSIDDIPLDSSVNHQLGTDNPLEVIPDIDFDQVRVNRQLLDEMRYRELRNAQLEYQRTGDPRAFQQLLAPFAATGDKEKRRQPDWKWSVDFQRFYCVDSKTGTILWCPDGPYGEKCL